MKLSNENLILTEIITGVFRFSYEPMDEETPSAEGLVEVDCSASSCHAYHDPNGIDSVTTGIEFKELQVWDAEGFQQITDTELGQLFKNELSTLIWEELV